MLSAKSSFQSSVAEACHQSVIYNYLTAQLPVAAPYDDLLRAQIVMVVAAFDRLMHDIIKIGMCECYIGKRIPTSKYHNEQIPIQLHFSLVAATIPPKEILFEQAVIQKLSTLSFQHPDKIADGLGLIWPEKHKWEKIGAAIGLSAHNTRTRMILITSRRNAIVHEADRDPFSNLKTSISQAECQDITDFVLMIGNAIVNLVI
jgi:hypothetical protein